MRFGTRSTPAPFPLAYNARFMPEEEGPAIRSNVDAEGKPPADIEGEPTSSW
jgi:hypothetical protein